MATTENPSVLPDRVLVYHNSIPVAICSTKLITQESLELHCGPLRYERNTGLEVEMQFEPGRPESRVRLPVRVVRCDRDHLVLSYDSVPEEAEAILQGEERHPAEASSAPAASHYAH